MTGLLRSTAVLLWLGMSLWVGCGGKAQMASERSDSGGQRGF